MTWLHQRILPTILGVSIAALTFWGLGRLASGQEGEPLPLPTAPANPTDYPPIIGAVLAEQYDEWATSRRYLTVSAATEPEAAVIGAFLEQKEVVLLSAASP